MIRVSEEFKQAMLLNFKEIDSYVLAKGEKLKAREKLISASINSEGDLGKTSIKSLTLTLNNVRDLLNEEVEIFGGVKTTNGFEYIKIGKFILTEIQMKEDEDKVVYKGYDLMINAMKPYNLAISYPITLFEYTKAISDKCNIELLNTEIPNGSKIIKEELFTKTTGITYRTILEKIAEITGTICFVNNEDKLVFLSRGNSTNIQINTEHNIFTLSLSKKYGPINSVVLAREPQQDNYYKKKPNEIDLVEYKISNNEFCDKERENYIEELYNNVIKFSYVPFKVKTEGYMYFEIGDLIKIQDGENIYETIILGIDLVLDDGLIENLKAQDKPLTKTNYNISTNEQRRLYQTEIAVDKQKQTITEVVKETENNKERINETLRTIDRTINTFKNMNGINLIKNSVMFSLNNENKPYSWNLSEEGTISIGTDSESIDFGGISRHGFELNGKKISQKINVIQDKAENSEKKPYSFSCLVKKTATGVVKIRLYNEMEEHKLEITEELNYKNISIENILPKMNYLILEMEGSEAKFTDVNLIQSTYKGQWTQATDELLSTNVQFDINGMKIFSETNRGDYTTITPYEFSGYSNASGSLERVFGIDKDKTFSTKLEAKEEFTLKPAKIVPKRTGEVQGIAFVEVVK
jgi:putative tail fiber|nr:MAG TPA: Minor structural protein putative tail fiber [Caudoviricetes sp.]